MTPTELLQGPIVRVSVIEETTARCVMNAATLAGGRVVSVCSGPAHANSAAPSWYVWVDTTGGDREAVERAMHEAIAFCGACMQPGHEP